METDSILETLKNCGVNTTDAMSRFMGDLDLYISCIGQFREDESLAMLEEAIKSGDYNKAFSSAHTLKGISGNMGFEQLYKAACEITEALRNGKYDNLDTQYSAVKHEYDKLDSKLPK